MRVIAFAVPGQPQGKGRARAGKAGAHIRMYTPAATVAYEGLIALAAHQAMAGAPLIDGPVMLEVESIFAVPASWSRKRRQQALDGAIRPTGKPDWDNVGKAVSDALNGVIWRDDAQVCDGRSIKRYGETPCLLVRVAEL